MNGKLLGFPFLEKKNLYFLILNDNWMPMYKTLGWGWQLFFLSTLELWLHCFLATSVADDESAVSLIHSFLQVL